MSKEEFGIVEYNRSHLFVASCIALVTTALSFSIRVDILKDLGVHFNLSHEQQGLIFLMHIWGFPIAILLMGPLCDTLGMGRLLGLACLGHIVGTLFTILAPNFPVLLGSTLLIGLANGIVEAVINPLIATLYPNEKIHKLNVLHAWWPGGLVIGGSLAALLSGLFSVGWQVKISLIFIPAIIYGVMLIGKKFPPTERAAAGVSTGEMFKAVLRPGFIGLLLCMCLTAVTELGPDQWVGSVLTDTVGMRGVLFLVYTAGLMFVLRFFAGPIAHAISPFGLLGTCALLAAIGLFGLSYAFTVGPAILAATLFGVGKTFFWPTMLGVASERFPRTGSLGLAMMGAAGMIATGFAGPFMGKIYDEGTIAYLQQNAPAVVEKVVKDGRYSPPEAEKLKGTADEPAIKEALRQGAALSFRSVAILPCILVVVFGGAFLYFKARGGYTAVKLTT